MGVALRRLALVLVIGGTLIACSPATPVPSQPVAAIVDGNAISMSAYQARLQVSRQRDPFNGIPEAIPSPAATDRLEDFTIEQLVHEEIIREQADARGIGVSDAAAQKRIDALRAKAGPATFDAALKRNGFTAASFREYERALMTEVALLQAMARDRANTAAHELRSGSQFALVAARWSDDTGTFARGGDAGWLRPADLPEPGLASAVATLPTGSNTGVIQTDRGFTIATVLERRADQVHLAVILVLAPSADLIGVDTTPHWFTSFITDRETALKKAKKIEIRVGSHAGG
jgi:parvulin-like peptidyl-prolyl isomerase